MKQLPISKWAEDDRPREKMLQQGASALTNAELLGILLGSGNSEETAVGLAQRILSSYNNNLNELGKKTPQDLEKEFKGIGPAKAVTVLAAIELGRRRAKEEIPIKTRITCSRDIYETLHPQLADLAHEEFWVIYLNRANKIIEQKKIGQGGTGEVVADIMLILRTALMVLSPAIVVVHNHPSGNCKPSRQDDLLTGRIKEACRSLNIQMLDHVIVSDGQYYSYADEGRL